MNKITLFIIVFFTILPYSIMGFSKDIFAQTSRRQIIRVSPVTLPLQLSPNKITPETIVVENLLEVPVPIRLDVEELSLSDTSDRPEVGKNDESSIAEWVTVPNSEFILAPREKKEISFSIQTPSSIPLGGYQAMIFIQPFFPKGEAFGSFLTSRIGVLVIGSVGTSAQIGNASTIQSVSLPLFLFDSSSFEYTFSLKSRSLYHFTARPQVVIKPMVGKGDTHKLDEKLMFPGKERLWEGVIPTNLSVPGWYSVLLQISVGNGQKVVARHNVLFVPPYVLVLLGFILVFVGVMAHRLNQARHVHNSHNKLKTINQAK